MKRLFTYLLFTLPVSLYAQQQTPEYKKWKIGLAYIPQYNNRMLHFSDENKWIQSLRDNEEISKYGFTTGATFSYTINNKWELESGLFFSDQGYRTKWQQLVWEIDDENNPVKSRTVYRYQYGAIPIKVNYYFNEGIARYFASAGISSNFLITRRTVVITETAAGERSRHASSQRLGFAEANLQAVLGGGLNYRLSNRFAMIIAPVFQFSLTSVSASKEDREKVYAIGLHTAVSYSFLKKK